MVGPECEAWWTVESMDPDHACEEDDCPCEEDSPYGCEEELPATVRALVRPWGEDFPPVPVLVCERHAAAGDLPLAAGPRPIAHVVSL